MNQNSVELGWIVTKPESDDYYEECRLFEGMPEDEYGHEVPGTENHPEGTNPCPVSVETHPNDVTRVFVSWVTLEHGWTKFTEPPGMAQLVRSHIAKYDQEAIVTWGAIETRR